MNLIKNKLEDRLSATFQQYICHAIQHALSENETANDVLQAIVNIQAALELLSKLFVLRRSGWKGIINNKFHDMPEKEVLNAIENGTITTTPYWKNKEYISNKIYLSKEDKQLIDSFQNYRNQVMHLGVISLSNETLNESIWLVVRIFNQLEWQEALPISQRLMSNSLELLLGKKLYSDLINHSSYVDDAVDRALELYEDVRHCIHCGNESWALNGEEYRICQVCGYRGPENAFGFINCPKCNTKGSLIYDPLNIAENRCLKGKCCTCGEIIEVCQCPECEEVYVYGKSCKYCDVD